jgi:hypothetical protein
MTTAAKASKSMPRPRLGVAPLVRAASSQPAQAASTAEMMKAV